MEQQRDAAKNHDHEAFIIADDAVHYSLYGMAGKSEIWDFFEKNNLYHLRTRILGLRMEGSFLRLIKEHEDIIKGVCSKNPDKAERGIRKHLSDISWNADSVQERYPDYFASSES
ncbi:MAG: FCD domain-containing protein [Bacteroides sp.]